MTEDAGKGMRPGSHGSTYGGNPLAMAVGNAVFDEIMADGFLDEVNHVASTLKQGLESLKDRYPELVLEVRGKGLLMGLKLSIPPKPVQVAARDKQLLVGVAGDNVLRLAPPLIMTEDDAREAINIIDACLAETSPEDGG